MYNVIKLQAPFERLREYAPDPETSLYRAVIMQMLIDASNVSPEYDARRLELEAKDWIFGNSEDFLNTCYLAAVSPYKIKLTARDFIARKRKEFAERQSHKKPAAINLRAANIA